MDTWFSVTILCTIIVLSSEMRISFVDDIESLSRGHMVQEYVKDYMKVLDDTHDDQHWHTRNRRDTETRVRRELIVRCCGMRTCFPSQTKRRPKFGNRAYAKLNWDGVSISCPNCPQGWHSKLKWNGATEGIPIECQGCPDDWESMINVDEAETTEVPDEETSESDGGEEEETTEKSTTKSSTSTVSSSSSISVNGTTVNGTTVSAAATSAAAANATTVAGNATTAAASNATTAAAAAVATSAASAAAIVAATTAAPAAATVAAAAAAPAIPGLPPGVQIPPGVDLSKLGGIPGLSGLLGRR